MICGFVLGNIYSQLHARTSQGEESPTAPPENQWAEKAIQRLQYVVDEAAEMGAVDLHGRAMTGLGEVLASLGRREQAQQAICRGIELLEQVNATEYLSQARKLLETL
jgi:hypothetical protein